MITSSTFPWSDFLARQAPRWQRVPVDFFEGPFVGNGLVGTIVFRDDQDPQALRFEIGRTDVYDHREGGSAIHERVRLPIGQLLLRPVGTVTACDLRLDLWNAELTGRLTTTAGTIDLRCLAPSEDEVLLLELTCSPGEAAATCRLRPEQGDSPRWTIDWMRDWHYTYLPNPPVILQQVEGLEVAVQPLRAGGDYATAWQEVPLAEGRRVVVVATAYRWAAKRTPWDGSAQDAVDTVRRALTRGVENLVAAHQAWWHAYYPASAVTLPDARLESFYWLQLYKFASATRPDRPVVDLMGPWFKKSVWAAYWQNLNTQLPYYLPWVANHPEFHEAPSSLLERRVADLIANVPPEWRDDCAALGNPTGYDSLAAAAPGPVTLIPGQRYNFIALPWLMQQFVLHVGAVADDGRLRTSVYPLLVRTMTTYLKTLTRGADGRLHLPLAFSDEYGAAEDTSMNLAFLRWGLETLLATATRLGLAEPRRATWEATLRDLAPYPVDDATGIMIGKDMPMVRSHRHSSHLFAIYPLQILTPDRDPACRPLLERSITHFASLRGDEANFRFSAEASLWATLGDGDRALAGIQRAVQVGRYRATTPGEVAESTLGPNTLYTETTGTPGMPTFESPIATARSLLDLLLQSRDDVIHVLPALPSTWTDLAFTDLRAQGAFLVSAVLRGGTVAGLRIRSLAGRPCRVRCPALRNPTRMTPQGPQALVPGAVWSFTLAAQEEVLISEAGTTPDVTFVPVSQATGAACWGLSAS